MRSTEYRTIFESTRGDIVESIHLGAFAIVNAQGDLIASWGNPETITFMRSSSKPLQALPFIEKNGDVHFGLSEEEIAILCASHTGTDDHVKTIVGIHRKMGLNEDMLQCGTHTPSNNETWMEMYKRGERPTPVRHMCSGKHSGMLGLALLLGAETGSYLSVQNPVQQLILQTLSEMTSYPAEKIIIGIDGCSAPVFALPLRNAALGIARLCQPEGLIPSRAAACKRITNAMMSHPLMVAGPRKFDTIIMEQTNHKVISKSGAEGYHILGVMPDAVEPGSPGLGIALKIADGDAEERARPVVILEILRQLGVLNDTEFVNLERFKARRIYNSAKLDVGEYRPAFCIK